MIGCAHDVAPPVGEVMRFELTFGTSGVTLTSVDYVLTGPGAFRRIGTLPVGDQPTVTATFADLPVGAGYDLVVRGTASDDATGCRGEVMFDVVASTTSTIQLPLICQGLAAVSANLNVCPVIDSLSAIPSEVYLGSTIRLTSVAHDIDGGPSPLTAIWSADGGSLSDLSTTGATFTCTAPGTFTVGVRMSDGEVPGRCPAPSTVMLTCTPAPSARLLGHPSPRRAGA
jgi:hypothetical protein